MKKILILFCITFFAGQLLAKDGDGGYAGAFLRMGMGARAKAMGDAYTAVPEGAVAGFYNPALLPHLKNRQLSLSFAFLPLDRKLDYVGYAQSLQPGKDEDEQPFKAGFAAAWVHAGTDNIDGRDSNGNHTTYFSNSENAFYLSFAISPSSILSFGVSGKVLYNRFPNVENDDGALTSTGFGMDFGAFLTPIPNVMCGLVIKDHMSKYSWNTDNVWDRGTSTVNNFPKTTRFGVACRIPQQWLLISADVENSKEQNPCYHVGCELSYLDIGAIRIGFDENYPTFGIGLSGNILGVRANVNYAFVDTGDAPGQDHIFSWTFDL